MPYCHISTQCDKYAEEEGRKQALEDEIERIQNELLDEMPEWAQDDGAVIDAAWRRAVEILDERMESAE